MMRSIQKRIGLQLMVALGIGLSAWTSGEA